MKCARHRLRAAGVAQRSGPDRTRSAGCAPAESSPAARRPDGDPREGVQRALAFLALRAGAAVADVLATVGSLFVMLFAMFFCCATATRSAAACGSRCRCLSTNASG